MSHFPGPFVVHSRQFVAQSSHLLVVVFNPYPFLHMFAASQAKPPFVVQVGLFSVQFTSHAAQVPALLESVAVKTTLNPTLHASHLFSPAVLHPSAANVN